MRVPVCHHLGMIAGTHDDATDDRATCARNGIAA